ncbi:MULTISPECIES: hypothetical protein [unclassified Cupriavidus]|uniref:hypothetical protein n=1 Tax=unclassified Cupriavidus TaxID=2640874 RepID=UPI000E8787CD|nr:MULTISPECIES: hypothetical protein [unclassified Cupriavidus]HBO83126.1 hypothetical protein [Cupriavidus sp.]
MPVLPKLETSQSIFSTGALAPQQISASPDAFGAQIGQAAQQAGQSLQKVGNDAAQIAEAQQAIKNETDVNDQYYKVTFPAITDATQKYMSLQGKAAVDALPEYQKQLEDIREQQREQLTNPMQQRMFDSIARKTIAFNADGAARHATQQQKVYEDQTSSGLVSTYQQTAAQHWNDPNAFNGALASIISERTTHGIYSGQPVEYVNAQIQKDVSASWIDRLKGIAAAGQASTALSLLKDGENWTDGAGNSRHTDVRGQILARDLPAIQSELSSQAADQIGVQYGNAATSPTATPGSGSLGVRNNNFGNLKDAKTGQFRQFSTPQEGMQAADANLQAYGTKHGIDTIQGVINRWAPASDNNDPQKYAATVAKAVGVAPDARIDLKDPAVRTKVLNAMFDVESPGWRKAVNQQPVGAAAGAVSGTLPVGNAAGVPNAAAIAPQPVGLAQDPATMKANQEATAEQARQQAQAHVLQLTGNPLAAKRAGDVAAATVAGNTNAVIAQQQARQQAASGELAKSLSGDPVSGAKPITSFADLVANPVAYAQYSQLSPAGQAAVTERLTNPGTLKMTQDSLDTYYRLRGQAANDPETFMKADLSQYFGKIPEPQLMQLINQQTSAAKRDVSQQNKDLNWSRAKSNVDDMLRPLGLGSVVKKTDETNLKRTEQFYGKFQEALDAYHDANQKYPDTSTTRKIAGSLLAEGTQDSGHWYTFNDKISAFESTDPTKFTAKIPDEQRPQLAAAYQRVMGRAPTDDELGKWYTAYKLSQRKGK